MPILVGRDYVEERIAGYAVPEEAVAAADQIVRDLGLNALSLVAYSCEEDRIKPCFSKRAA